MVNLSCSKVYFSNPYILQAIDICSYEFCCPIHCDLKVSRSQAKSMRIFKITSLMKTMKLLRDQFAKIQGVYCSRV